MGAAAAIRRATIAAALCGGSACTLLSGADELSTGDGTSTGGPDGGSGATSDPDGGGQAELAAPDTGLPPADSGGPDVPTSVPTWCSSVTPAPRACLDFDAVALEALDKRTENGSLALEAAGSSAPNALFASIADDREGHAFVRIPLATSPTRVSWSFDIRLDRAGPIAEFCELRLTYSGGFCAIQSQLAGNELRINEYCEGSPGSLQRDHEVTTVVEGTGYHRFSIAVDFTSRKVTAQVQRPDGVATPIEYTLEDRIVAAPVELRAGVSWSPARPTGAKVLVDNVTADWQ